MGKSNNKADKKVLSLSREEADKIGIKVEHLIKNDMRFIVNKYVTSYYKACHETFGWEKEDILQHIRILLWKGVATFEEGKNAKLTTYLSSILNYRMFNLSKKIKRKKYQMCKLDFCESTIENEDMIDFGTPEDWYSYAQNFAVLQSQMNAIEEQVLIGHLIHNSSLSQMEKDLKVKRPMLVAAVKSLKEKMKEYLGEYYEENRFH